MCSSAPPPLLLDPSSSAQSPATSSSLDQLSIDETPFFVPPEIVSVVIKIGCWTPHDLAQLARVNKTFLMIVRPVLYRTIHLETAVTYELDDQHECDERGKGDESLCASKLEGQQKCASDGWGFTVSNAVASKLLRSLDEYPHLASLVVNVGWRCYCGRENLAVFSEKAEKEAILSSTDHVAESIKTVAQSLDHCLSLDYLRVKTSLWKWTDKLAEALHQTTVIRRITKFAWNGRAMWWDLESFRRGKWAEYPQNFKNLSELFRRMQSLEYLQLGNAEAELAWFGQDSPIFPLRSFSIDLNTFFEGDFTCALLLNTGNTLQQLSFPGYLALFIDGTFPKLHTLELGFTEYSDEDSLPTRYFLSRCPNLHHLALTFKLKDNDEDPHGRHTYFQGAQFEWVPPTLQILTINGVGLPVSCLTKIINTSNLREIRHRGFGVGDWDSEDTPANWSWEEEETFSYLCEEKGIKVSSDDDYSEED